MVVKNLDDNSFQDLVDFQKSLIKVNPAQIEQGKAFNSHQGLEIQNFAVGQVSQRFLKKGEIHAVIRGICTVLN